MSNSLKRWIHGIPTWVRVGILFVIFCGSNLAYTELRIEMEKDESYIRFYFVECKIKVSYDEKAPIFIDLFRIDDIFEQNQITGQDRLEFKFLNSQLGVEANFSKVEIFFYLEKQLWEKFDIVQANFFIEDKSGVIRKYDFDESLEGLPIYIGIRDITNLMWKDAVPQEIRSNVIFNYI